MKNLFWKWSLGLSLTGLLPFAGGCLQDHSKAATPVSTNSQLMTAAAPAVTTPTNAPVNGDTNIVAEEALDADGDVVSAPARPVSDEKPMPPNVKPTPPTAEIIKLANSGVDESVMLAFVTNSANTFNLGADEVVYLTDLGVPPSVLTAMIQHDQMMKNGTTNVPSSSAVVSSSGNILIPSPGAPAPYQAPAAAQSQPAPEPVAADPNSVNTAPPPSGEQAQAAPGAPDAAPTSQVFYDSLSPYGTWLEVEGYGRVWQPSVVVINRSWRPYYDNGRWVYTNHGWYWYSDYSWGWAPFHYGRWFRHAHYGWCWTPDYVWGPSWVTWRYTSDYCGWAPLPPAAYYRPGFGFSYYGSSVGFNFGFGLGYNSYSFVHFRHFREHRFHNYHRLPREQVTQIYNKTVVVNKIVGDNNTIINSGVPVENVARATKREVPRVQVREVASAPVRGSRAEQLDTTGSLAVYRPRVAPTESGIVKTAPRRPETLSSSPRSTLSSRSAVSAPLATSSGSSRVAERPSGDPPSAITRQTVAPSTRYVPSRSGNSVSSANPPAGSIISRPIERPSSVTSSSRSVERGTETVAAPTPGVDRGSAPVRHAPTRPSVSGTIAPRAESAPTANAVSPVLPGPTASRPNSESYTQRSYGSGIERQQAPSRSTTIPSPSVPAPSRQVPAPMATPSRPSYSAPQRSTPSISAPSPAPYPRQYATPAPSVRSQSPSASPSYSAPVRPTPSYSAPARPAPSYSAPAPTVRSAPSYSAPAQSLRSTPSYSAPRAAPTPSYSAPSRSTPSPSYSAPSRPAPSPSYSAPSRSYSGGGGRDSGSPRQQAR